MYEDQVAQTEKYKGYFKKEKAKQAKAPKEETQSSFDAEAFEAKMEFYQSNPEAKEYKAEIEGYVQNGLSYDKALKLTLAEQNPNSLIDPQTINKQEAGKTELTGTPVVDS